MSSDITQGIENPYEASDRLFTVLTKFADFEQSGLTITSDGVRALRTELREIEALSKAQAHEISRHRWNAQARADTRRLDEVYAIAQAPNSNVAILPVVPRPQPRGTL